jgi:hypothetical protein
MANDFSLFTVDWVQLVKQAEGARTGADSAELKLEAPIEVLESLRQADFAINLRQLTKFHSTADSFKIWGALAYTYSEARRFLPPQTLEAYDEIYVPFLLSWMKGTEDEEHPWDLPLALKQILRREGMFIALEPGRANRMARNYQVNSFSRLVHSVLASPQCPPPLPGTFSWLHSLIGDSEHDVEHLHAAYTAATEGWRILVTEAERRKWGIAVLYQI